MRVEDLVFEVRDASLNRVGQLTPADGLTSFQSTLRLNNVGSWQIDIPEGRPLADALRAPGAGIVVTNTLTGAVVISGPTVAATKTSESGSPVALWSIRGADDTILLSERLAYPTPTSSDVTAQTSAYDSVVATKASTAMIGYVRRNLVSGVVAPARAVPYVTTYADPAVGSNVSYAARFDILGQVCTDIAAVDGLAFDMYQSGAQVVFKVWQPVDLSKTVRLDIANNTLQKSTYGYGYGISRAIVGGQGEGTGRTFAEVSTSASLQTESSFGRRVERFVDQRQESDSAKLTVAGQSVLADSGGLITSVDVVPTSDTTMRPLVDFNLGDKVSVVVATQEVSAIITQLSMSVTDMGVFVGITVGNPVGVDFDAITAKRATDSTARISNLETLDGKPAIVSVANGGTGANTLTGYVKGNGTSAMTGVATIPVTDGGTGLATLTSGAYLKGAGTAAVALQTGIPATDITSGALAIARGGTGATSGAGLVPMIPSSIAVTTGTGFFDSSTGLVTFSGVTSVSLNGVFSTTYRGYKILVNFPSSSATTYVWMKFRTAGSDNSSAGYFTELVKAYGANSTVGFFGTNTNNSGFIVNSLSQGYGANGFSTFEFYDPASAPKTNGILSAITNDGGFYTGISGGLVFDSAVAFDGLTLYTASGTMGGSITVYGYR